MIFELANLFSLQRICELAKDHAIQVLVHGFVLTRPRARARAHTPANSLSLSHACAHTQTPFSLVSFPNGAVLRLPSRPVLPSPVLPPPLPPSLPGPHHWGGGETATDSIHQDSFQPTARGSPRLPLQGSSIATMYSFLLYMQLLPYMQFLLHIQFVRCILLLLSLLFLVPPLLLLPPLSPCSPTPTTTTISLLPYSYYHHYLLAPTPLPAGLHACHCKTNVRDVCAV